MKEKSKIKSVATRLTDEQLAKARDGLISRGISAERIKTKSQILRLSVFLAITSCSDPKASATTESLAIIK